MTFLRLLAPVFLLSTLLYAHPVPNDASINRDVVGEKVKRVPWSAADQQIDFVARDVSGIVPEKRVEHWIGIDATTVDTSTKRSDGNWIGIDTETDASTKRDIEPSWIGIDASTVDTNTKRAIATGHWIGIDSSTVDTSTKRDADSETKRNAQGGGKWIGIDALPTDS